MARRTRIDLSRVATSALDTAMNGEPPRRNRFSGVRAVAAGAVLVAAARVAVRKAPTPRIPGLGEMPDLSELTGRVRDRLAETGLIEHEEPTDEDFEEELDREDEDFDDEDEDEGGEDDDWDGDEDDRGPDAEGDDEEAEDSDAEDGDAEAEGFDEPEDDEPEDEEPDDDESEDVEEPEPLPIRGNGRASVDPAARPPEPPRKKSKAKAGAK